MDVMQDASINPFSRAPVCVVTCNNHTKETSRDNAALPLLLDGKRKFGRNEKAIRNIGMAKLVDARCTGGVRPVLVRIQLSIFFHAGIAQLVSELHAQTWLALVRVQVPALMVQLLYHDTKHRVRGRP